MTPATPFRVSATKLKRFLQCPRSYFLKYVQGVEEDVRGNYLVVGNAFDQAVQHYVSRGARGVQSIDPKIVRMLDATRRLLPEPGSVEVQHEYRIEHPDGFVVEGKPDLRQPGWVGDTKTCAASGPGEGSAMTQDQLQDDVQFRLYSWCEYQLGWEGAYTSGIWTYVNKDAKPKAWNVATSISRGALDGWFDSVVRPAVAAMRQIHAEYDADRVLANLDSCERCWVRKHCSPYDGPNSYDGVDPGLNLVQLKGTRPVSPAKSGEENMAFDIKKLSEDVDLTGVLEASVAKAKAAAPDSETIAINPPKTGAAARRKETPAETHLEDLASELQTVVDTCQTAIARVDRLLAAIRAKGAA